MKSSYKIFIGIALVLFFMVFAFAETINLTPSDDMYTDEVYTDPHPTTELWVADFSPASNYQRLMMKFDLSELEDVTVTGATLHIYRFFGCPSGDPTSTRLFAITQSWAESSWPETQHISHETNQFGSYIFSANGWQEIDLTSIVQEWVGGSRDNHGFVFEALTMNKFSKCYSKEAAENMRPYLEVVYQGSGSNTCPEITLYMPPTSTVEGTVNEPSSFMVRASDADNDSLTYTWKVNETVVTTDQGTGTESNFAHTFTDDGQYTVAVDLSDGAETVSHSWTVTISESSVAETEYLPLTDKLLTAYPNPFNPSTKLSFQVKQAGHVSLAVYNILGYRVNELQNGYMDKGNHTIQWHPGEFSSGVYFIRLDTVGNSATEKIIYMR